MGGRKILIVALALASLFFTLSAYADEGPEREPYAAIPSPAAPATAHAAPSPAAAAAHVHGLGPDLTRDEKPLTLKQKAAQKHLDGGLRLETGFVYDFAEGGFKARAKAVPFLTAGGFELALVAFDNLLLPFDEESLGAWYAPPGGGALDTARHVLKFVDRIRYGTTKSKFHFHLGSREPLDFAPNSFIATMDGGFDRFLKPGTRRLALCAVCNSDSLDFAMFLDDLDKSASGTLRGGLRFVGSPFKSYRLAAGAGVYLMLDSLRPFSSCSSFAPFVDLTFPIIDKSSFNLAFSATALCGLFPDRKNGGMFDSFLIEGRFPIAARSGRLKIDIAVAWNKGHRFSSAINDTKALEVGGCFDLRDPAFDHSSLDLVIKVDACFAKRFFLSGYLDIPFQNDPDGGFLAESAAKGLNSDVAMFKIGWNGPVWGCALRYSVMGLSSRLREVFESLKDPSTSKFHAFGALVGSRYAIAALEGRLELGFLTLNLDFGFATKDATLPYVAARIVLDLSKGGFSGSGSPKRRQEWE